MPTMRLVMPAGAARSARRQHVVTLLGVAASLALLADFSLPTAFSAVRPTVTPSTLVSASVGYQASGPEPAGVGAPAGPSLCAYCGAAAAASAALVALGAVGGRARSEEPLARRQILAGLGAAAAAPVAPAFAAEVPFLGRPIGPFEIDPKDVVIVGDDKSEKAMAAKDVVIKFQKEAEAALETLKKDPQADLAPQIVTKFGIAELRDATNLINNLVDENSQKGTQRHQRLMIQAKYALEDDLPMPVSKKGVVQARGDKRLERVQRALDMYVNESKELMAMLS